MQKPREYVNAGVLVLDLKRLRKENDVFFESLAFFREHPDCDYLDQDALNYVLKGKIGFIEDKFNMFSLHCRKMNISAEAIFHFAGDFPRRDGRNLVDRLFWTYYFKTPWWKYDSILETYQEYYSCKESQVVWLRKVLLMMEGKKKVFWGVSGLLERSILSIFPLDSHRDFCVDNNHFWWGKKKNGLEIREPALILTNKNVDFMIIVMTLHFDEVKKQLEQYGYVEDVNFIDGRKLLNENERGYC